MARDTLERTVDVYFGKAGSGKAVVTYDWQRKPYAWTVDVFNPRGHNIYSSTMKLRDTSNLAEPTDEGWAAAVEEVQAYVLEEQQPVGGWAIGDRFEIPASAGLAKLDTGVFEVDHLGQPTGGRWGFVYARQVLPSGKVKGGRQAYRSYRPKQLEKVATRVGKTTKTKKGVQKKASFTDCVEGYDAMLRLAKSLKAGDPIQIRWKRYETDTGKGRISKYEVLTTHQTAPGVFDVVLTSTQLRSRPGGINPAGNPSITFREKSRYGKRALMSRTGGAVVVTGISRGQMLEAKKVAPKKRTYAKYATIPKNTKLYKAVFDSATHLRVRSYGDMHDENYDTTSAHVLERIKALSGMGHLYFSGPGEGYVYYFHSNYTVNIQAPDPDVLARQIAAGKKPKKKKAAKKAAKKVARRAPRPRAAARPSDSFAWNRAEQDLAREHLQYVGAYTDSEVRALSDDEVVPAAQNLRPAFPNASAWAELAEVMRVLDGFSAYDYGSAVTSAAIKKAGDAAGFGISNAAIKRANDVGVTGMYGTDKYALAPKGVRALRVMPEALKGGPGGGARASAYGRAHPPAAAPPTKKKAKKKPRARQWTQQGTTTSSGFEWWNLAGPGNVRVTGHPPLAYPGGSSSPASWIVFVGEDYEREFSSFEAAKKHGEQKQRKPPAAKKKAAKKKPAANGATYTIEAQIGGEWSQKKRTGTYKDPGKARLRVEKFKTPWRIVEHKAGKRRIVAKSNGNGGKKHVARISKLKTAKKAGRGGAFLERVLKQENARLTAALKGVV